MMFSDVLRVSQSVSHPVSSCVPIVSQSIIAGCDKRLWHKAFGDWDTSQPDWDTDWDNTPPLRSRGGWPPVERCDEGGGLQTP